MSSSLPDKANLIKTIFLTHIILYQYAVKYKLNSFVGEKNSKENNQKTNISGTPFSCHFLSCFQCPFPSSVSFSSALLHSPTTPAASKELPTPSCTHTLCWNTGVWDHFYRRCIAATSICTLKYICALAFPQNETSWLK